jgi:hypothetical protein
VVSEVDQLVSFEHSVEQFAQLGREVSDRHNL